ncbi:MAG: hypothetical protein HYS57_01680 [Parcubacteria group bacterium]|nr:hypothetical protein [Parcubacteria group bacterium]
MTDYAFIRPDKIPVLGLSYMCDWKSREVVLGKDMDDYAWVDLGEAKGYDLIEGIYDELVMAAKNL